MRILLTILFIFISMHQQVFSQQQSVIDSLLLILPQAKEDSNKVKLLNEISYNYPYINPDEGLKFGNQAFDLANQHSGHDNKRKWNILNCSKTRF